MGFDANPGNRLSDWAANVQNGYINFKGFLTLHVDWFSADHYAWVADESYLYSVAYGTVFPSRTAAATYKSGSVVRLFGDGTQISASGDSWGGTAADPANELRIVGSQAICLCYERVLTDAEIVAIDENPYQILQPLRQTLYSFPSGAPTGPVLSAATVIDIGATSARPRVTITIPA